MRDFYKRKRRVLFVLLFAFLFVIGAGTMSVSGEGEEQTLDMPIITKISSVDYQHITFSWNQVEGAEGYRIYRKTVDSSWKRIAVQSACSYKDKVQTGVTYYYTVRAYSTAQDGKTVIMSSYQSSSGVKAVAAAPSVSAESARWDAIKVSWKGVAGADGYRIYGMTSSGWKKQGDYKATTRWVNVGGLNFNQEYQFTVRAYTNTDSGKVWGKYKSAGALAVTKLNKTELKEVKNTSTGLQVLWSPVRGAEGYRVYRKDNASGSSWKRIAQLSGQTKSSYTDKKAVEGASYYYTVRAYRVFDSKYILSDYNKKGILGTRKKAEADQTKPMVALTYDDGPSANTPKILDLLEKYDAKATFFVVGDRVDGNSKYQSYVKRAYKLGCQIGNHTYEHKTLTKLSEKQIQSQMSKCDAAVKKAAGITPSVMRPPGGSRNATVDKAVGKPLILWSIDTEDWKTRNASKTISAVLDHVKDGDIILMHDLYEATAEASETIIPSLIKKGYQLVTVEELAKNRGGMKAGKRYSSFRK